MARLTTQMLDAGLRADPSAVVNAMADTTFARHGYYGVMPREVRLLLAEAGIRTAAMFGIVSVEPVALFVQAMVDMSPRFWVFEPFKTILVDPKLNEHQKMQLSCADDMAQAWDAVMAHLVAMEEWHLEHWDTLIDWETAKVRD